MHKELINSREQALKILGDINAKENISHAEVCTMGELVDMIADIDKVERKEREEASGYSQRMMPYMGNSYDPYMANFHGNVYGGYGYPHYEANSYDGRGGQSSGGSGGYSNRYDDMAGSRERDMMHYRM